MTNKFNPFVQWLGLDSKIKNPTHFQLLGVSPKLMDQAEIQKAVDAGVKRSLVLLSKIPADEHAELLPKVKQRLAIARKTLLDPKLRHAYIVKLKQNIQAQKSAQLAQRSSQPAPKPVKIEAGKAQPTESKPKFTPPTIGNVPEPPVVPKSTTAPVIAPAPSTSTAPIPMAVPLNAPASTPPAASGSDGYVNADGVPIDEVRIDRKAVLKRKKSKAGLIATVLMLLVGSAGAFLIYQNWGTLMELGGVDPESPAAPGIVDDEDSIKDAPQPTISDVAADPKSAEATEPERKLPTLDLDKLPELNVSEVMEHPETAAATMRDAEAHRKREEWNRKRLEANGIVEPEPETVVKTENPEPDKIGPPAKPVTFNEFQLSKIRRHLERARRHLHRHELSHARTAVDYANSVLVEATGNETNVEFDDQQAPVAALVGQTHEIVDLIEGFWQQVIASCESIPGGQEIIASGQTLGFIEGDSEKFIIRHAGSNVTYEYDFCPRSLAVSLAKQGAIRDIPTWNRELAAFYAIDQLISGSDHRQTIDELLTESEEAGHDCAGIRQFASFQFGTLGRPAAKIEMPNKKEFGEDVVEFREENMYDSVDSLTPETAEMLAELLLQIDSPNFRQHVSLLEEGRQLGMRCGNASMVEDAIIELDQFANIDRANLMCESFLELSDSELSASQRRKLLERAIPFLKSDDAKTAKVRLVEKLTKNLMTIAEAYGMIDAARRLNSLGNQ